MTADMGAHHNRAWVLGHHDIAGTWSSVHDLISGGEKEKLPEAVVNKSCVD